MNRKGIKNYKDFSFYLYKYANHMYVENKTGLSLIASRGWLHICLYWKLSALIFAHYQDKQHLLVSNIKCKVANLTKKNCKSF